MARPKSSKRSVRLSVSLDEDDHKAVKDMADTMDLSTAWVVRRAVSEFLERHGKAEALPLQGETKRVALSERKQVAIAGMRAAREGGASEI